MVVDGPIASPKANSVVCSELTFQPTAAFNAKPIASAARPIASPTASSVACAALMLDHGSVPG